MVYTLSDEAKIWWKENVYDELAFGGGFACEPRMIQDLCHGILGDGLTITKDGKEMYISDDDELCLR